MDENISTAALMVGLSSAWLHLSFPPFPASIQQSKVVHNFSSSYSQNPERTKKCTPVLLDEALPYAAEASLCLFHLAVKIRCKNSLLGREASPQQTFCETNGLCLHRESICYWKMAVAGGRIGDARSCVSMPWLFRVFYYGACLHHRGLLAGKSEQRVILSLRVFEIAALSLKVRDRWQKWPKPQCCPPRRWACADVMTLEWILIGKWWGKQCRNRKEDEDEEEEHL